MRPVWLLLGLAVAVATAAAAYWGWEEWLERSQEAWIRAAASRYGVAPALVKAVVWRESRFRPWRHGKAGEIGLMQLREKAAREWASAEHLESFQHEHCYHAGTNTLAGTWYLRKLLGRYLQTDNPLPYALADYNAGRGNVLKWNRGPAVTNSAAFIQQIGFPGTRRYVQGVMARYERYQPQFAAETTAR